MSAAAALLSVAVEALARGYAGVSEGCGEDVNIVQLCTLHMWVNLPKNDLLVAHLGYNKLVGLARVFRLKPRYEEQ